MRFLVVVFVVWCRERVVAGVLVFRIQVIIDGCQEGGGVALGFVAADTADLQEFLQSSGRFACHVLESGIGEDDVGRQFCFLCQLEAKRLQHGQKTVVLFLVYGQAQLAFGECSGDSHIYRLIPEEDGSCLFGGEDRLFCFVFLLVIQHHHY